MPSLPTFKYVHGYGKSGGVAVTTPPILIDSVSGTVDGFIVKYATNGTPIWAARITGTGNGEVYSGISTDSSGNVYAVGSYTGVGVGVYNADGTPFGYFPIVGTQDGIVVKYNSSGTVLWVARMSSSGIKGFEGCTTDSSGNAYAIGYAQSLTTVFNSDGTTFGTIANAGLSDIIIIKYNSSGTVQWTARIAGTGADTGFGIAVDSSLNVYVTGSYTGTVTVFNANTTTFGTLANAGGLDVCLVKYNSAGTVQWTTRIGGTGTDEPVEIDIDSAANVYITGYYTGTVTIFNTGGGTFGTLANAGSTDAFIVEYNTNGVAQWATRIAGTGADRGNGISVDPSANVYVCGAYTGTATIFSAGGGTFGSLANDGNTDGYIVKYNSSGIAQWGARIGGTGVDTAFSIAVDLSGNVYITGQTGTTAMTVYNASGTSFGTLSNTGGNDTFAIKYNTSGAVQWTRKVASSGTDNGLATAVDSNGNMYLGGSFNGTQFAMYGQAASLFSTLTNAGGQDSLAVKYNTNGAIQWAARIADVGNELGWGTATDSSGNVYFGGTYTSGLTLSNADGSTFTTFTGAGAYIVKYNSNGTGIWAVRFIGNETQWPYGMAVDTAGNLYVCGEYRSTTTSFYNSDGNVGLTLNSSAFQNGDAYLIKYNSTGFAQWTTRCTSASGFETGWSVTTDSSNNVYMSGNFTQTMTILNFNGTTFGTLANAGGSDGFLIKYNSSGTAQWSARVASTGNDYGYSVAVDSAGNVIMVGMYLGSPCTAYNSNGTAFATTLTQVGVNDAYVVKYNSTGFVQWFARMAGSGIVNDYAYACDVDTSGNVYISGGGAPIFYNANGTAFGVVGNGGFLVKYSSAGTVRWVCNQTSTGQGGVFSLTLDSVNNIYVGMVSGGNGVGLQMTNSDGSSFATVSGNFSALAKYDSNGFGKWVRNIGNLSTPNQYARTAFVSVSSTGDVYFTGQGNSGSVLQLYDADNTIYKYLNTLGGTGLFIVKQSSTAIPQWAVLIANGVGTNINQSPGTTIKSDSSGNVYVCGRFGGATGADTLTFYNANGTAAATTLTGSVSTTHGFVVKYNSSGGFQWAARITGTSRNTGITVDSSGNVYACGVYTAASDVFSSDNSLFTTLALSGANTNGYLIKYNSNGIVQWTTRVVGSAAAVAAYRSISVDSTGNIYGTGIYGSTITAYNAADVAFATTFTNTTISDVFIIQYDTNGNVGWFTRASGNSATVGDNSYSIDTSASGTSVITGDFGGTLTAWNANNTSFSPTLLNSGGSDVFVLVYNSSGTVQWVARVASGSTENGYGAKIDSGGNVVISGQIFATATAFNANGTSFSPTIPTMAGSIDVFLVKYNSVGTVQWVSRGASANVNQTDTAWSVSTDSAGAVYLAGFATSAGGAAFTVWNANSTQFASTAMAPVTGNTTESFLVKYNTSGAVQWLSKFGGTGSSGINCVDVDSSTNIYTAGYFSASALVVASS